MWAAISRVLVALVGRVPPGGAKRRPIPRTRLPGRLTDRQAAYVAARRGGVAPTAAARAAGYSIKSAAQIASTNERLPSIRTAIDGPQKEPGAQAAKLERPEGAELRQIQYNELLNKYVDLLLRYDNLLKYAEKR